MTITSLDPILVRRRVRTASESTPESQRAESLQAVLDEPNLSGYHDDARAELAQLTATSVLAA